MSTIEVKVPDIGDFSDIPVITVFVKPGDTVAAEDALIELESDKATMEVPSPSAGEVREVRVSAGDRVSEGSVILLLEAAGAKAEEKPAGDAAKDSTVSDSGSNSMMPPGTICASGMSVGGANRRFCGAGDPPPPVSGLVATPNLSRGLSGAPGHVCRSWRRLACSPPPTPTDCWAVSRLGPE